MSDLFTNRVRAEVERYLRLKAEPRNAQITAYNPATYSVKVKIMPEAGDATTGESPDSGWLKLHSQFVGNGWGMMFGPAIGAQVSLRFQENDPGSGSVEGAFFDAGNQLPEGGAPPSGEAWLIHKSGSFVKLTNDGKASINSATEIDVGNLQSTVRTLVHQAFQALYNEHTHAGGAVPDQQMTSAHLTVVLKAN